MQLTTLREEAMIRLTLKRGIRGVEGPWGPGATETSQEYPSITAAAVAIARALAVADASTGGVVDDAEVVVNVELTPNDMMLQAIKEDIASGRAPARPRTPEEIQAQAQAAQAN